MAARPRLSLKGRALRYLAQREHSRAELERKLAPHALRELMPEPSGLGVGAEAGIEAAVETNAEGDAPRRRSRGTASPGAAPSVAALDRAEAAAFAAERVRAVLDELQATGLLDERRAAEALVRAQAGRFGGARLRHRLRQAGIPPALADAALAQVGDDETARAHAVWRKRFGGEPPTDARERARQARFLAGRGFGTEAIRRVLRGVDDLPDVPTDDSVD